MEYLGYCLTTVGTIQIIQKKMQAILDLRLPTTLKGLISFLAIHQKAFDDIKRIMTKKINLNDPKFDLPFNIHADASDRQLGAYISQGGKPLGFYSRKQSGAQRNYTITELLSIAEPLKELRSILLGQII